MSDSTETNADAGEVHVRPRVPYLFVVLEGQRPIAGGARLRCDELDEIVVGRGDARGVAIDGRCATLTLPDRRMSTTHARIQRVAGGWELVDAESKNGCRVDGHEAARVALRDGAWIELGQSVLRFRVLAHVPSVFDDAESAPPILGVVTLEPSFEARLAAVARLAPSMLSLAITGATGTGKELLARAVHAASGRPGPFVAVNCSALSAGLVESQLFGHKRGAFSGAIADHDGLIRTADRGTLLLDEVADLPPPAQATLLRVLQEREVLPVGETVPRPIDVRFLCATHHDLAASVRADLYARLAGHVIELPPIVARREDIGTIVATALRKHRGTPATMTIAAAMHLATAAWPHNAREIDHAIEAALALAGDVPLDLTHLPVADAAEDVTIRARLEALLVAHRGNVSQIARDMGKARMQIQRWLKRWDLDPERFR